MLPADSSEAKAEAAGIASADQHMTGRHVLSVAGPLFEVDMTIK